MFGTSGIRGEVGDCVTATLAVSVGRALGTDGATAVVVGRDVRESGELLESALVAGLRESGATAIRVGRAATPTIARAVGSQGADAGVSITASHNPPKDNGFKLWTPSGQAFDAEQRAAIAEIVRQETYDLESWDALGAEREWAGATAAHRAALVEMGPDLSGMSIVVDIGNGTGQVTADVLADLGADVRTLNARPDGSFPARPSEPTAEACEALSAHVATTEADLGVAHDGDADRMMAVDESGAFLPGDVTAALFARRAVSTEPNATVAVPINTSQAVDAALEPFDASVVRTRVGDVYVAERAAADHVVFGGEPSGAWIWPEETLCPDGPLAAVKMADLVASSGPLSALRSDIPTYPLQRTSIPVDTDEKADLMSLVSERLPERIASESVLTLDGVRIETAGGWLLVRASGTQPLIRLTAEGQTEERAAELLAEARSVVEDCRSSIDP